MSPVICNNHGRQAGAQLCCDHILEAIQSPDEVGPSVLFEIDWASDEPRVCTPVRVCERCAVQFGLKASSCLLADNVEIVT